MVRTAARPPRLSFKIGGRGAPTLGGSLCGEKSALPLPPSCWAQPEKKASWTRGGFHAEPWGPGRRGGRRGGLLAHLGTHEGRAVDDPSRAATRRAPQVDNGHTPSTLIPKTKTVNKPKKLPPPAPITKDLLAHELVDVEVEARGREEAHLAELRREAPVQLLDPAYPHQVRRHAPEGDAALARP